MPARRPTPSLRSLLRLRHRGDLPYKIGWVWPPSQTDCSNSPPTALPPSRRSNSSTDQGGERRKAITLGVAGALSFAGGASEAAVGPVGDTPTENTAPVITLGDEEISDVSLATFYVFDNENAGARRPGLQLARGRGHGGCAVRRGYTGCAVTCGGCGGCGGGPGGPGGGGPDGQ
jgi:hypothetical protein